MWNPTGGDYLITDVLTNEDLGAISKRKLKKVSINNTLRNRLKFALAGLRLSHPDPEVRLDAVNEMLSSLTPESKPLLAGLFEKETDANVKEALTAALSIIDLNSADKKDRLTALDQLAGNLNPAVRNELVRLISDETDPDIRKKAEMTLSSIELRVSILEFIETVFFGLSLGSVLVLASIGLAITFAA